VFPPSYYIFRLLPFKSFHSSPSAPGLYVPSPQPSHPLTFSTAISVFLLAFSRLHPFSLARGLLYLNFFWTSAMKPCDSPGWFIARHARPARKLSRSIGVSNARPLFSNEQIYAVPHRILLHSYIYINAHYPSLLLVTVGNVNKTINEVSHSHSRTSIPLSITECL